MGLNQATWTGNGTRVNIRGVLATAVREHRAAQA